MTNYLSLGASLYVPAANRREQAEQAGRVEKHRSTLLAVGNREKYPVLKSLIFDTEDSVRHDQVNEALGNLASIFPRLNSGTGILRFVRVRNPHVMGDVLQLPGVENIDGFVLPKVTRKNLQQYLGLVNRQDPYLIMPTLETQEVFDRSEMERLRDLITKPNVQGRILSLRIGGNDLLAILNVRRCPKRTIYDTALGRTISNLVTLFKPAGLNLTGTVFEGLKQDEVLKQEVEQDLLQGLFGKTAIHPSQIPLIENQYAVTKAEYEEAEAILAPDAPAVFKMNDRMCECTVHRGWAESIMTRRALYGLRLEEDELLTLQLSNGHAKKAPVMVGAIAG